MMCLKFTFFQVLQFSVSLQLLDFTIGRLCTKSTQNFLCGFLWQQDAEATMLHSCNGIPCGGKNSRASSEASSQLSKLHSPRIPYWNDTKNESLTTWWNQDKRELPSFRVRPLIQLEFIFTFKPSSAWFEWNIRLSKRTTTNVASHRERLRLEFFWTLRFLDGTRLNRGKRKIRFSLGRSTSMSTLWVIRMPNKLRRCSTDIVETNEAEFHQVCETTRAIRCVVGVVSSYRN